jgi:hypothetical protein
VQAQAAQPARLAPDRKPLAPRRASRGQHPLQFGEERGGEADLGHTRRDLVGPRRHLRAPPRMHRDQHEIVGAAVVDQRIQRRVRGKPAVPVRRAVDRDRVVQRRQAGRREQRFERQFVGVEDAQRAGFDARRRDEQADRLAVAHALEVDRFRQQLAQRVQVERIPLRRRQPARHLRQRLQRVVGRAEQGVIGQLLPEVAQRFARVRGVALRQPVREQRRVDGAGTGAAGRFNAQAALFEQAVEHAPGERAMRSAALQGERDPEAAL